jgi:hypothetical protein
MQPQRLSQILPGVMAEIDERRKRYSERHQKNVLAAVKDFHRGRRGHQAGHTEAAEPRLSTELR